MEGHRRSRALRASLSRGQGTLRREEAMEEPQARAELAVFLVDKKIKRFQNYLASSMDYNESRSNHIRGNVINTVIFREGCPEGFERLMEDINSRELNELEFVQGTLQLGGLYVLRSRLLRDLAKETEILEVKIRKRVNGDEDDEFDMWMEGEDGIEIKNATENESDEEAKETEEMIRALDSKVLWHNEDSYMMRCLEEEGQHRLVRLLGERAV
ncbi:hypothetical protein M3J09_001970 [Ascochyta lentis]